MSKLSKIEIIAIAAICHEANRAYCEILGDRSQIPWETAPQWQRESAIKGVELHVNDAFTSPQDSHDAWMKEKTETGWKYGPVKDVNKKEHHCLVPFDALPVEQQVKDFIFHGIVHAMVHRSPMFVYRY